MKKRSLIKIAFLTYILGEEIKKAVRKSEKYKVTNGRFNDKSQLSFKLTN